MVRRPRPKVAPEASPALDAEADELIAGVVDTAGHVGADARLSTTKVKGARWYARWRWPRPHPKTGKKSLYIAPVKPVKRTKRELTDEQQRELTARRKDNQR
jgi:hypothetical protein